MNSMLSMFVLFTIFLGQIVNFFILPKKHCALRNIYYSKLYSSIKE